MPLFRIIPLIQKPVLKLDKSILTFQNQLTILRKTGKIKGVDMKNPEIELVYSVAKLSPWIAPIPSSFFVARACLNDLDLPLIMAILIGFVIESLGLTSIHTCLVLQNWNLTKRKTDPNAPLSLAIALVFVYLFTTIGLSVFLDTSKELVKFAPALFPMLSVVGSFNITLLSQQKHREMSVQNQRFEMQFERQQRKQLKLSNVANNIDTGLSNLEKTDNSLVIANRTRKERRLQIMEKILDVLTDEPTIGITDLSRKIGRSRQSVYNYIQELENGGKIHKNNDGFVVESN
jgi:predicted transcriptional regulator